MCVQFLHTVCLWASEPLCCLSDITAQQCMTGSKATSSREMWIILPTLLAPLFIPSAPRVRLLFHQWRRHTAVITLPPSSMSFFFFFLHCCVFACRQQLEDFTLVSHSLFPFWILWFMGLAVVISLERHFKLSDTLYSDNHSTSAALYLTHTCVQESCATATSEKILVGKVVSYSWLTKLKLYRLCTF